MITYAFTCSGACALLIMMGLKRVENRSAFPRPDKGRCAVSVSKKFCRDEYDNLMAWLKGKVPDEVYASMPTWGDVKDWPGKIVGACDYVARAQAELDEQWNEGYPYWWDLSEVVSFDNPIPCRGNVGMWQLPSALAAQVTAADLLERSVGEVVATAEDAARIFRAAIPVAGKNEGFFVLPLDVERRALAAPILVALGEATTTAVDPGEVFSAALQVGAKAIIVAHNHPSGNLTPSVQDKELTTRLMTFGAMLSVEVLDHLIVSDERARAI